ncbi:MAG: dihydrofolate reductase family protein [Clostridiales bacterium]
MNDKPYVLVKCAMSVDGYIDDSSDERLILSDENDFERVDIERAKCDAVLIGAETVRKDNPRLLLKSEKLINERITKGKTKYPMKVTITSSGNFSKDSKFFNIGDTKKIVYCPENTCNKLNETFNKLNDIDIVSCKNDPIDPVFILKDLKIKGVNKLMIEGGSNILTTFLSNNLVDEIQISIAPFFVGDKKAPKFVNYGNFPFYKNNRMKVKNSEIINNIILITYQLN